MMPVGDYLLTGSGAAASVSIMNAEHRHHRDVVSPAEISPISGAWYYVYFTPRLCWRGDGC
jgi:hypothetical protein